MGNFKAAAVIVRENLDGWRRNDRVLVVLVLAAVLIGVYMGKLPFYGLSNGTDNTAFLLPLLMTSGFNANGSIKVLLLFGTVLLFCNAPFMDARGYFLLLRSRRRGWWIGEVSYIAAASLLYVGELVLLSTLLALPCASVGQGWGESILNAFYGGVEEHNRVFTGIKLSPDLIMKVSPEMAMLYTFCVLWLVMVLLGLVIYCINLYSERPWPGVAAAVFLIVLDPVLLYTMNQNNAFNLLLSPVSWCSMANLRFCSGMGCLSMPYIAAAGTGLSVLLVWLIARKTERMDILLEKE